jgi:hypothetical protein
MTGFVVVISKNLIAVATRLMIVGWIQAAVRRWGALFSNLHIVSRGVKFLGRVASN